MTRYVIEFRADPGKSNDAMRLFRHMKDYFKDAHQKTLDVFYQTFGTPGTFRGVMDFESMGQLEELAMAIRRDPAYQKIADEARTIFTSDSFSTTVYNEV